MYHYAPTLFDDPTACGATFYDDEDYGITTQHDLITCPICAIRVLEKS
jgi:hypothetical protein